MEELNVQFILQKIIYNFTHPCKTGPLIVTILQMVLSLLKVLELLGSRAWVELCLFASGLTTDPLGCTMRGECCAVVAFTSVSDLFWGGALSGTISGSKKASQTKMAFS